MTTLIDIVTERDASVAQCRSSADTQCRSVSNFLTTSLAARSNSVVCQLSQFTQAWVNNTTPASAPHVADRRYAIHQWLKSLETSVIDIIVRRNRTEYCNVIETRQFSLLTRAVNVVSECNWELTSMPLDTEQHPSVSLSLDAYACKQSWCSLKVVTKLMWRTLWTPYTLFHDARNFLFLQSSVHCMY